jgi:hypothetical protein
MEFSFFTTNNKSGYKTRENWLSKNEPEIYDKIINYRKSMLIKDGFDPNKTEHQIMLERSMYRIYDCGTIRWEYDKSTLD